jgi:hypothetical protein
MVDEVKKEIKDLLEATRRIENRVVNIEESLFGDPARSRRVQEYLLGGVIGALFGALATTIASDVDFNTRFVRSSIVSIFLVISSIILYLIIRRSEAKEPKKIITLDIPKDLDRIRFITDLIDECRKKFPSPNYLIVNPSNLAEGNGSVVVKNTRGNKNIELIIDLPENRDECIVRCDDIGTKKEISSKIKEFTNKHSPSSMKNKPIL